MNTRYAWHSPSPQGGRRKNQQSVITERSQDGRERRKEKLASADRRNENNHEDGQKQGDGMYSRTETMEEERREGLHEPSSTTLRVDFLESLFLLSLVDDAESSHEETQNNGHEPVNGGEDGVQSVVSLLRNGCHTERFRLCDKGGIGTECSAHLHEIRSVEVTTTLEHILDCNPGTGSLLRENRVEVCPQAKSKEPDVCAGDSQINHVGDEQPVQENEATGNVVPLDHGPDRERPGNEEEHGENKPDGEIHVRQDHVHENVRLSPHD